eukprot:scaffold2115_cov363-Pavlova_lutheri.AAC.2
MVLRFASIARMRPHILPKHAFQHRCSPVQPPWSVLVHFIPSLWSPSVAFFWRRLKNASGFEPTRPNTKTYAPRFVDRKAGKSRGRSLEKLKRAIQHSIDFTPTAILETVHGMQVSGIERAMWAVAISRV